jgi:hypothetical protein
MILAKRLEDGNSAAHKEIARVKTKFIIFIELCSFLYEHANAGAFVEGRIII